MSSKKIAIIGSHCVGKTTLCKKLFEYLRAKGYSVGLLEEVVRSCPFPVNEMTTVDAQDWILREQKKREAELNEKYEILILDRGVIDNFAYWLRVAQNSGLDPNLIKKKEREVFRHSAGYHLLFFLHPFESEIIENDNFRSVDPVWRKEMHERVLNIVEKFRKEFNVPIVYLKGTEEEVFEKAKKYIDELRFESAQSKEECEAKIV